MKRTFTAFSVRFMQQGEKGDKGDKGDTGDKGDKGDKGDTGDKGQDSVTLYVSEPVVTVQADSNGFPLKNVTGKELPIRMYKGGVEVSDAVVATINGEPTQQTLNGITLTRSGNKLLYSVVTPRAVSPLVCTVTVYSASLVVTRECVISFAIAMQGEKGETGAQGIQGMQGKTMRRRGDYTKTLATTNDTIYNNSSWMDWIIYEGKKYRLRDNVLAWTKSIVVLSDGTTVNGTYPPHSSSPYWEEFSELRDAAFSFIIARGLDVDNASICEAFIGTTGATANDDETVSLASGANGWAITGGQIRHTKTGLTLTADGYISDPDGLHMRVGGEKVRRNLIPNAYFDKTDGITALSGAYVMISSAIKYGKSCIMVAGGSQSGTYTTNDILMATVKKRVKLNANKTYTMSYCGRAAVGSKEGNAACGAKIRLYSAETGGTLITQISLPALLESNVFSRSSISFSTTSVVYFDYCLGVGGFSPNGNSYYFDAVKLEEGAAPSEMSNSEQADLLATGIDIEQGKITFTADNFIYRNNKGETTALIDDSGNMTIAGVYNNEVNDITDANANKYGVHTNHLFYLDPLKCPAVIRMNINGLSKIILPVAYNGNTPSKLTTYIEGSKAGNSVIPHSLEEMRQCIGKKIWLLRGENLMDKLVELQSGGGDNSERPNLLMHVSDNMGDLANITGSVNLVESAAIGHKISGTDYASRNFIFECKMGVYNGYECIYWEIRVSGIRLL